MSGKAKQYRDEWEIKMIGVHQSILEMSAAETVQKRALTRKMTEMENIWQKLVGSHGAYCRAAKVGLSSPESTEYLKEKEKLREEILQVVEKALEVEDKDLGTVKRLKKVLEQLKAEVEVSISALEDFSVEDQLTREAHEEAVDMVQRAMDKVNRYVEVSREAEELMEDTAGDELASKTTESFKKHGKLLSQLKLSILKKAPAKLETKPRVGIGGDQVVSRHAADTQAVNKQPVKIKPLDCPTWDGKFKTFARFKKLWSENITPRHEDSALHYMLCQALPKTILDNISTLTNSADEIWDYLEDKYGKPEIVAREVMSELMGLDAKKLGGRFIGRFCTTLLDTHTLLASLGEEDWLTSNRTVSELESKLPREEKFEWAKQQRTLPGDNKFEKFKCFLQQRKDIMEAMEGMGDKFGGGTDRCSYCAKPGHMEDDCHAKQRAQSRGGKSFDGCAICSSPDHWKNECPEKGGERDRDRRFNRGRGSSTNFSRGRGQRDKRGDGRVDNGGGGSSVGGDIGSNVLRPLECPRCKYSSKLTSCAGCKKTANINHCLLHCPVFNALSVNDKVTAVKGSKSCAVCLHPTHVTDKCDFKDKDKNICGIDGCQSHHHPCLHGSKDAFVTGVNVLLLQQVQAVAGDIPQDCVPVSNWLDRQQYVYDSYGDSDARGMVRKTQRESELEEVRCEMAKPLINGDKVLMVIMELDVVYGIAGNSTKLVGFFDDGSNCSVIRTALAEQLGLWGDPVTLELGTVNATTVVNTKLYCVELVDMSGTRHLVRAFGLETLSGPLPIVSLKMIKGEFSVTVQLNWEKLARPGGEVDLLIGSEMAHLHPVHMETVGRMVVKTSIFGQGWVLNGAHEAVDCGTVSFDRNVQIIRSGHYSSNRIVVKYNQIVNFETVEEFGYAASEKEFMSGESLGCEPPRRCLRCKGCKECAFRGANMSPKEALELRMMESKICFDKSIGKWRVSYPFLQDPRVLTNNYRRVLKMAENLERKLVKAELVDAANEVFNKMVDLGALEEISSAELDLWNGPVHYLPIQAVVHLASRTTPVRLVTNSSLVDPATGLSLNGILARGPMVLNDLWGIFVRFRHQEYGLIGDISKAYYQMVTGPVEKHVRRVLWRNGDVGTPWRIYGFTVVSMGDGPAACFMELTRRGTAEMSRYIDPVASEKIGEDAFVDDITTGGTEEECLRFKGNMDPETCVCDGTIPQILLTGGYVVKAIGMSGEPDGKALDKLGGAVLGHEFSTAEDILGVKFKVNVSPFKHGKPTGPDLTPDSLGVLDDAVITKRICLRVTNSQFDMVGIAAPITIKLRVHMKDLYTLGVEWDQSLVGDIRKLWVDMFSMLIKSGGIKFRRATRPVGAVGRCILICYFDGSNVAFAAAIYARWDMEDGSVVVYLVVSKSRVAPMFGTSTPRLEMDGATLLSRLVLRVIMALLADPPGQVFYCGDSETILASREKKSGFFGEYFGNRIGEQMDNQERVEEVVQVATAGEWYHVPTADNAADRPSRLDSVPDDLGLESEWLCGPAYLKKPVEEWPLNRLFAEKKKIPFPAEEVKRKFRNQVDIAGDILKGEGVVVHGDDDMGGPGSLDNYVLKRYDYGKKTNDWNELVQSTSSLFCWLIRFRDGSAEQSVELLAREMAVVFWVRVAMPETNKAAVEGKLKHLSPLQHAKYPDMLVVVGRAVAGFRQYFQKDYLPILMSRTRTGYLIMLWAHGVDHAGVDVTFQTALQVAWVVGGRALARGIKRSCVRCRYLARKLEGQQMSSLPAYLSVPCPCFTYVGVDLAGPFVVKKEGASKVTRRNTGTLKVWAVLIVCLQTKAVKIYLVGGLGTEDFLLAWDCFESDHGQPMVAHSDRGSNLVSASKEGGEADLPDYDWDSICTYTKGRTEWHFHPAQSQFRNGCVESFVKKFKRTLKHKFGPRMLFMLELQACFKVVATILNSRPIYARWGSRGGDDPDYLSPLTPNMLLTGRANTEIPVRDYGRSDKPLYRLKYVEECVSQWWAQFMSQNFSSLVPRQKWFFSKRNMQVGDVVLIHYEGKTRPGTYRLGIVKSVVVDPDGLVRTVTVQYSLLSELASKDRLLYKGVKKKLLVVPVQRLVLILPVEERDLDGDIKSSPGGQAGTAPHEEVEGVQGEADHSEEVDQPASHDRVTVDRCGADHIEQPAHGDEQAGQHVDVGAGGVHCDDRGGKAEGVRDQSDRRTCEQEGDRVKEEREFVTRSFRMRLKYCAVMEKDLNCEDFEGPVYQKLCNSFNWAVVDGDSIENDEKAIE